MDEDRRSPKEDWDYRAAVRRFQSAFEAAARLSADDRKLLLEKVAGLLLDQVTDVPSEEQEAAEVDSIETNQAGPQADDRARPPDEQAKTSTYDFYRSKAEPDERMATLAGAGLPGHVERIDWEPMTVTAASREAFVDVAEDIASHGFCYFKLVE